MAEFVVPAESFVVGQMLRELDLGEKVNVAAVFNDDHMEVAHGQTRLQPGDRLLAIGPGMGALGPMGNFEMLPAPTKGVMYLLMVAGRLEVMAFLVVLAPSLLVGMTGRCTVGSLARPGPTAGRQIGRTNGERPSHFGYKKTSDLNGRCVAGPFLPRHVEARRFIDIIFKLAYPQGPTLLAPSSLLRPPEKGGLHFRSESSTGGVSSAPSEKPGGRLFSLLK